MLNKEVAILPYVGTEKFVVARAPRNINRHVPTLSELQSDIKAAFPTNEASVDLSILTCTLTPAHLLYEDDKAWTFDSLLRVRRF